MPRFPHDLLLLPSKIDVWTSDKLGDWAWDGVEIWDEAGIVVEIRPVIPVVIRNGSTGQFVLVRQFWLFDALQFGGSSFWSAVFRLRFVPLSVRKTNPLRLPFASGENFVFLRREGRRCRAGTEAGAPRP